MLYREREKKKTIEWILVPFIPFFLFLCRRRRRFLGDKWRRFTSGMPTESIDYHYCTSTLDAWLWVVCAGGDEFTDAGTDPVRSTKRPTLRPTEGGFCDPSIKIEAFPDTSDVSAPMRAFGFSLSLFSLISSTQQFRDITQTLATTTSLLPKSISYPARITNGRTEAAQLRIYVGGKEKNRERERELEIFHGGAHLKRKNCQLKETEIQAKQRLASIGNC